MLRTGGSRATAAASRLKLCVIRAHVVVQGCTRLRVVQELMHKRVVGIVARTISPDALLVVAHHIVHILQLVVGVASTRNTILVVEVVDSKRTIAAIQANVSIVTGFAAWKCIKAVSIIAIVVEVPIISLKLVDEIGKPISCYKL